MAVLSVARLFMSVYLLLKAVGYPADFVYSSIHPFILPSFHPSTIPSFHLSILPSFHPSNHQSVHLSPFSNLVNFLLVRRFRLTTNCCRHYFGHVHTVGTLRFGSCIQYFIFDMVSWNFDSSHMISFSTCTTGHCPQPTLSNWILQAEDFLCFLLLKLWWLIFCQIFTNFFSS